MERQESDFSKIYKFEVVNKIEKTDDDQVGDIVFCYRPDEEGNTDSQDEVLVILN